MTYAMRIRGIIRMLSHAGKLSDPNRVIRDAETHLENIAAELDATPRDKDGAAMRLLASFPYMHSDDRDRMRVALYDKRCGSGDGVGELILCTEGRENHHDGYREAVRMWGEYEAYFDELTYERAFIKSMAALSRKCKDITGPYARAERSRMNDPADGV